MEPISATILSLAAITSLTIFSVIATVAMMKAYYNGTYNETKQQVSDADIFKLMAKANHFLTAEQLAAITPLSKKQADKRLNRLALDQTLRRFQDGSGLRHVFQLREELPEDDVLPISIKGLTEHQIVEAVMAYSDDYQITTPALTVVFGITVEEAKVVLKRLKRAGLVRTLWKGMSRIYVVKDAIRKQTPKLEIPDTYGKTVLPQEQIARIKIPDADILNLAIEHKGRLTVGLVCLKLKVPIVVAEQKLQTLYDQGAFFMEVEQEVGVVEYHLRDVNLLS